MTSDCPAQSFTQREPISIAAQLFTVRTPVDSVTSEAIPTLWALSSQNTDAFLAEPEYQLSKIPISRFKSEAGGTRTPPLLTKPKSTKVSSTFRVDVLTSVVVPRTYKSPLIVTLLANPTAPVPSVIVIDVVPSFAFRLVASTVGTSSNVVMFTVEGSPIVTVCPETDVSTSLAVPEIVRVCEVLTVLGPPPSAFNPRVKSTASTYALTAFCVGK